MAILASSIKLYDCTHALAPRLECCSIVDWESNPQADSELEWLNFIIWSCHELQINHSRDDKLLSPSWSWKTWIIGESQLSLLFDLQDNGPVGWGSKLSGSSDCVGVEVLSWNCPMNFANFYNFCFPNETFLSRAADSHRSMATFELGDVLERTATRPTNKVDELGRGRKNYSPESESKKSPRNDNEISSLFWRVCWSLFNWRKMSRHPENGRKWLRSLFCLLRHRARFG